MTTKRATASGGDLAAEKRREVNRRWYEANHDEYNELRRRRYAESRRLRHEQRQRDVERRRREKSRGVGAQPRLHDGQQVWTISQVAATAGCTRYSIEYWEEQGLLPEPTVLTQSGRRLYLRHQALLIIALSQALAKMRPRDRRTEAGITKIGRLVQRIAGRWAHG